MTDSFSDRILTDISLFLELLGPTLYKSTGTGMSKILCATVFKTGDACCFYLKVSLFQVARSEPCLRPTYRHTVSLHLTCADVVETIRTIGM